MKSNLLDLFYNYVAKEASNGRVDCFFKFNMLFHTKIQEIDVEYIGKNENSNLIIPTLMIKNRREFESLLLQYVERAMEFYEEDNYYEEIRNSDFRENEKGISKEKLIMTLLWSNATVEDFNDPCTYLRKRIALFDLGSLERYLSPTIVGYSEILGANIEVSIVKSRIESETPYFFQILLRDVNTDEKIYEFPRVYAGISGSNAWIYAIQISKNRFVNDRWNKKIERTLYKVNEGFDIKEDTFENYSFGNLKDITPSFLVAANIVMGILKQVGISKVCIPSILVSRWNSKMFILQNHENRLKNLNVDIETMQKELESVYSKVVLIQSNLTEKFLRTFRRVGFHHSTVGVSSYSMDVSSDMIVQLYDGEDVCNNSLLEETFSFQNLEKVRKK